MWKRSVLTCLLLLSGRLATADEQVDVARLKRELLGTWKCTSQTYQPPDAELIKSVTPTHWSWVLYDPEKNAIISAAGGVWRIREGHYEETCAYSTDPNLRGKTFAFSAQIVGDKWEHRILPGGGIVVDEVWTRCKPETSQKANTGQEGRKLLGSWRLTLRPDAPATGRIVKHVTPTHWIWVVLDIENGEVTASYGGTWSLRDGEYVETCLFTTDNFPRARGKSNAYQYQVKGNRWILKSGPGRFIGRDETWTLLK